jgi:hypothetical protein
MFMSKPVLDAIDYFTKEGGGSKMKGGLCIFASGNNGATGNYYPACYAKSLAVELSPVRRSQQPILTMESG